MKLLRGLLTVLGAFGGIRKQQDASRDALLAPIHIIASAVLLLIGFVAGLLLLVSWITRSSGLS